MFTIYRDVLSYDDFIEQYENLRFGKNWQFIGESDIDKYTFWYNNLIGDEFYNDYFFNKIKKITNKNLKLNRVYANGQTFGLPGGLHVDDTEDNTYTFLFYLNPEWNVTWGGNTIFYNDCENFEIVVPKPNMGVLFKSNMLHVGMDPSRYCKDLRITVAFKMEEINE